MEGTIRVSIANLAVLAGITGGEMFPFGILNPKKLAKGEMQYMALGGAAMLSPAGQGFCEKVLGASGFEIDEQSGFCDARFLVREQRLEEVFARFSLGKASPAWLEEDPTLDIMAELTGKEFPGYSCILPPDLADGVLLRYRTVVRQKPADAGADTSERAAAVDVPTRRLFRIYELHLSPDAFNVFSQSSVVRFLTDEELVTTDGGAKAGRTSDGIVIQNNLFPV